MELSTASMELLYEELESVAPRWHVFGVMLMMDVSFLSGLEGKEDAAESFRALLTHWLETEVPHRRTWQTLAMALNSSAVGQTTLAARIRKKYPRPGEIATSEGDQGESPIEPDEEVVLSEHGVEDGDSTEKSTQGSIEPAKQPGDTDTPTTEQPGDEATTTVEQPDDETTTIAEQPGDQPDDETTTIAEQPGDQPDDETTTIAEQLGDKSTSTPAVSSDDATAATASNHVFCDGWSSLGREEVVDKVKGVIYGHAIGDALGLATEFMSQQQARKTYGKKGPSKYDDIINDFHRSRWDKGDWTDDTDQMLLILQMIVECGGRVDEAEFARRIQGWMREGFKELGDIGGMGIGMTVHRTLCHHLFLEQPHTAAREVWEQSGRYLAANGAIMRTSILGVLNFNDTETVVRNTSAISLCTHADPRCTASCVAVTTAIALMLQGGYNLNKKDHVRRLIETSLSFAEKSLELKDQAGEMREHVMAKNLDALKLDDKQSIGYTFKALGAGFYALREGKDFLKTIKEVIMQGGDADSNASVCGALLGCRLGFSALPGEMLQFPHRAWLDTQVNNFLKTIGLA